MEKGGPGEFLDCDACPDNEHDRRCMGCGWLPASQHLDGIRWRPEASVCPGYLVRLPEVIEAARALSWSKRGGLVPVYGDGALPQVAVDAIDILEHAINETEGRVLRERREAMKQP